MKKSKLIFATMPVTAIAMITPLMTSCNQGTSLIVPTINAAHGTTTCSDIYLNHEFRVAYIPDNGGTMNTVTVVIGDKTLVQDADDGYTIDGDVIIVKAKAVTSSKIVVTITARALSQEETGSITEPENENERKANSVVYGDLYINGSEGSSGSVFYTFNFTGEFTAPEDISAADIEVTALLGYTPAASNAEITGEMPGVVTKLTDKTKFTISLKKEFQHNSEYKIGEIPGISDDGTSNIELKKLTIKNNTSNKTYVCTKSYTPKIVPNILLAQEGETINLSNNSGLYYLAYTTKLRFVNIATGSRSGILPGFTSEDQPSFTQTLAQNYCEFKTDEYNYFTVGGNKTTFSLGTATKPVTVSLKIETYDHSTLGFKKEAGAGPDLKLSG